MLNVFLTGAISFIITYLAIPAIMRVAKEKKLYYLPDARKLHTKPIASLGGVGIFIGFFLATLLTISKGESQEFQFFFASAIVIFFLGLKDDILILSARKKFLGQLAATAILVHLGNVRIDGMHGFFGLGHIPLPLSYLVSYITIIVVVNAYNLIDGVDGLAGSLGVLTMSIFGGYFLYAGLPLYSLLAFAMTGSLVAFLVFNYHPAKIFMGDSGSLLIGLLNAILVIKFINVADSPAVKFPIGSAVALGFAILIVPLLDTLRVFSIRIAKGRSPFSPDRNHIHHLLLDRGLNHKYVTFSCLGLNVAFIAMAYLGRSLGPTVLICSMTAISFAFVGALMFVRKSATRLVIASSFQHSVPAEQLVPPATKVVALKNEAAVAEQ
ncbi:MAG TPA: MraY family glycosyltransferase [Flavisolibacter sp.]|nr:MraY family glycosyltransferase [Flavisolibacter sp.]